MIPCSSCHRHLRESESVCPFCGAGLETTTSVWGHVGALALSVVMLGSSGCAKDPSGVETTETSMGTAAETGETTGDPTTETDTGGMVTDTNDSTSNTSNTSGSFYAGPDVDFGSVPECDPFLQDCPDGEKCAPYSSTGGNWDANKCVPVLGDGAPGDPCSYDGTVVATDTCDETSMCWNVGPDSMGTCVPFCEGNIDAPLCPVGSSCLITSDGCITLCIDNCDPILQDCDPGTACYWSGENFNCIFTSEDLMVGEPCGFLNDCAGGLYCTDASVLVDCQGDQCCAAFCDLDDVNACADPNYECVPFFEMGQTPAGYEHVGVCIVPPP